MASTPNGIGTQALVNVSEYADRLVVHRSTATHTDITEINDTIKKVMGNTGESPLIVVDYLQKVAMPLSELGEEERITRITEQLKDVAIEFDAPVFAVAAMDHEGLEPGARMRTRHMRGSTALSYEPDVVLILGTKSDLVARHHLMYGGANAEHFKDWSVAHRREEPLRQRRRRDRVQEALRPGPLRPERQRRHREARRRARLRRVGTSSFGTPTDSRRPGHPQVAGPFYVGRVSALVGSRDVPGAVRVDLD